jgi:hypothetical protein
VQNLALLTLPVLALRVGRQRQMCQMRASHKNFNFFCAWAKNKNIEAQACVLADVLELSGER